MSEAAGRRGLRSMEEIRSHLSSLGLGEEEERYARIMLPRFKMALDLVERLLLRRLELVEGSELAILDVAPHLLTELFSAAFPVRIHTVGATYGDLPRERHGGEHLMLDLNDAHRHEGWRGFHRADVVFMGEIIEHLHASPRMVLGCASRWVKDEGYLVVQTPNAVALDRRLTLLFGKNPYDMIREGDDPGHFREYTRKELVDMGKYWGLEVEEITLANYFDLPHRGTLARLLYGAATRFVPSWRDGMTVVFRRPAETLDPRATSRDIRGFIEGLEVNAAEIRVRGWAIDLLRPGPVAVLELVHGEDTIFGVVPTIDRPDVVAAHGAPRFLRCGFEMTAPRPPACDPDRLAVRTRDVRGDWYDLERVEGVL